MKTILLQEIAIEPSDTVDQSDFWRWIPLTKASDAELWYLLWFVPEQPTEQTIELWSHVFTLLRSLYSVMVFPFITTTLFECATR